ncbi:MAG TPA: AbrB/MazE/SpoVT family DNA-binding domain-containing protein [Patescibacteria group bacterium]|nr:AbrB/MazE/SpoVT family DNA-binding domain-containing protein [Patescibacteria group bacterium]
MQQMVRITSKRQITIPAAMYKKFKLSAGDNLIFEANDQSMTITPAVQLVERLAGSVSVPRHLRGEKDLDKVIEKAKENYFREKYAKSVR